MSAPRACSILICRRFSCFPAFILLSALASLAQSPSPPPPAPAPSAAALHAPASDTTVDTISVDLIVRTKHNRPVLNLEPSDLAVSDDGVPVRLSSLRLLTSSAESQHLVTLVFDRLDPGAAKTARTLAGRILKAIPNAGYSFAVLQVNGRLRLLQPWTADRRLVEAAIDAATPPVAALPSPGLSATEKDLIAAADSDSLSANRPDAKLLLSALEQSQRILEERHTFPSLAALQGLIASQSQLSGRKFILYFSQGIAADSDARDEIRSIVSLANRGGVTLCAVDANPVNQQIGAGMQAAMAISTIGMGGAISSSGGVQGNNTESPGFTPGSELNAASAHNTTGFEFGGGGDTDQSPLIPLASATGGIYIRASGGDKHQIQQLHNDLTNYYQASWVPPIKDYNGEFRPIEVRPLRKGLVVRSRAGYFAVPPGEASGIRPFEVPLLHILAATTFPTDIAFRTAVLHLGELPDGNSSELDVEVPVSQLQIHEDANTHISSAHASILAVIENSRGDVLQRFGEDFPLHEAPDKLRLDPDQVISLERHFSADPGVYTLETAVLDRLGNQAGAQRTTFTVEPAPHGPALSDIALVRSVDPIEQIGEDFEPMRYMNGRIVPDLAGELAENTRSLSLFFLVHPAAGSPAQPSLRLQLFRNHQLLTEMPIELHRVSGTGAAIPYFGTLQGHAFPAGNYDVKALLTQDGQTASASASFSVEGTIAASTAPNPTFSAAGDAAGSAAGRHLVAEAATANSRFVIASPANPVPAPTAAETQAMLEGARKRALAWSDTLQNFFCVEITNHSIDATGHGDWKHKDTLVELMRYIDHRESRSTVLLNDSPSTVQPDQLQFAHSGGEFGAMFHLVFDPSAKTDFTWKESAFLDGQPVQVFAFKVARANSAFGLFDHDNHVGNVGFHGLLYLDPATLGVRRITVEADDIPPPLLIRASSVSVDYSWIAMNNHDFLLPVRGAVSLQEDKSRAVLNEFEFRDYHRFGSQIRVLQNDRPKTVSEN
ncbi:MAG: VWA domain-containing protein [Acidobacteriaceae bacterium]